MAASTTSSSSDIPTPSSTRSSTSYPPSDSGISSPATPRSTHPTILNLPSYEQPTDSSGPSTPMSCISTIAIKDGHEGHRPEMSGLEGAAERISRLAGVNSNSYFDARDRQGTPASVGSTESGRREGRWASLIDGMVHDDGVVDTTEDTAAGAGRSGLEQQQQQEDQLT